MADDIKDAEDKLLATLPKDGDASIYEKWWMGLDKYKKVPAAWRVLDKAITDTNPSGDVLTIQKELKELIDKGSNLWTGKTVTSDEVRQEIKKLEVARETDRQAKLQAEKNTKLPEPTPEEKAKFLNSIKSPWDTAKDLARALGGNNGVKVFDRLPEDLKEKLTLGDIVDGDAARNLFAGKVPINTSGKWDSIYADKGPNGKPRKLDDYAQKIKDIALVLQENPDLINDIRTAMGKAPVQTTKLNPDGMPAAPGTSVAQTTGAAQTPDQQKIAELEKKLSEAQSQQRAPGRQTAPGGAEAAFQNTMLRELAPIVRQQEQTQKLADDMAAERRALNTLVGATAIDLAKAAYDHSSHHRFLKNLNPENWFDKNHDHGFTKWEKELQNDTAPDPSGYTALEGELKKVHEGALKKQQPTGEEGKEIAGTLYDHTFGTEDKPLVVDGAHPLLAGVDNALKNEKDAPIQIGSAMDAFQTAKKQYDADAAEFSGPAGPNSTLRGRASLGSDPNAQVPATPLASAQPAVDAQVAVHIKSAPTPTPAPDYTPTP